jgi:pimeloyl-ACP methyl ester carboxylesterase
LDILSDQRLLAPYRGEIPPRPSWFDQALTEPFSVIPLTHAGAALELRCWGQTGRPGMLLLHGNRAHARWWSPLAGLLARDFRVAALSWSGMGRSDWRTRYSLAGFADEALAAAQTAGLFDCGPPLFVAHSLGGGPGLIAAQQYGDRLAGVIIVDTHLSEGRDRITIPTTPQHRVQASVTEALSRSRLVPKQDCVNHYYVDWIARNALREVPVDEADGPGLAWAFDSQLWDKLEWYDCWTAAAQAQCPLVFVDGDLSAVTRHGRDDLRAHAPTGTRFEVIAGAAHHVMLDKPLELLDAIRRIAGDHLHM